MLIKRSAIECSSYAHMERARRYPTTLRNSFAARATGDVHYRSSLLSVTRGTGTNEPGERANGLKN